MRQLTMTWTGIVIGLIGVAMSLWGIRDGTYPTRNLVCLTVCAYLAGLHTAWLLKGYQYGEFRVVKPTPHPSYSRELE